MRRWLLRAGERAGRVLAVSLCVAMLSACSLVSVAYNRLPTWMDWRLQAMWQLSSEQRSRVQPLLQDWHRWHRAEHLPRYAAALREWQALALYDVTAPQVCAVLEGVRVWADEAVERLLPVWIELGPTLSPAQIDHWSRYQARQDARWIGDAGDAAQGGVSDARWQRTLGRIETVYGRLDDAQRLWLRDRLARSAFDPQRVSAERQARIADARAAVVRIQGGAAPADEWRRWWAQVAQSPRPDYRAYSQLALQDLCVQWADLHNRTTPAQRQHAANKLQSFEREALILAGRASR